MSDYFVKIPIENDTVFCLNTDGVYVLKTMHDETPNHDNNKLSKDGLCLLQCYSNGYINKTPLAEISLLRKNYNFSHGLFKGASILHCGICSEDDYIIVIFEKADKKYIYIKPIASITSHSMLGLKGYPILQTTFDVIYCWYILSKEQSIKLTNLVSLCSRTGYVSLENQECPNEFVWIKENIIKFPNQDVQVSDNTSRDQIHEDYVNDSDFDFSILIGKDHEDDLRDKFTEYLKSGRNIPMGQKHVMDVLSICNNTEDFWRTIICLLDCSVKVYRSPILSYFQNNQNNLYVPDYETLKTVIGQIFSVDDKIEKNLEFLYPFREMLSQEDLSLVKSTAKSLSQPEHFHMWGEILKYTPINLILFCLNHNSVASYYSIYEVFQKSYKVGGMKSVRKLMGSVSKRLDQSGVRGKLIKNLINNVFQIGINYITPDIDKIKSGGFAEFVKICNSYEGKKKHKNLLNQIASFVGKNLTVTYIKKYQNHYLLNYCGICVLLPKCMTKDKLSDGCAANVVIVMADKTHQTLFATQQVPVDYGKITQTPLLNDGDIIEVTFDLYRSPIAHNCYNKIKVSIASIPKSVDYKARYQARVIRQTSDKFHYLVKLM